MRVVTKVLSFVGLGLVILLSLVFSFIEFRSLFAGDFQLMNNPGAEFVNDLFRSLYYLAIFVLAILVLISLIRDKQDFFLPLFIISLGLLAGAFFSFAFYVYYVTAIVIFINLITASICGVKVFVRK